MYWPKSLHDRITPGGRLSVTLTSATPYAEFQIRKFNVNNVSIICIYHYCYSEDPKLKLDIGMQRIWCFSAYLFFLCPLNKNKIVLCFEIQFEYVKC